MSTYHSKLMELLVPAYRMHSQTFIHVLEGISEQDAQKRIDDRTNHILWMVGNFVNMRYALAWSLGLSDVDPHQDLFYMGKALDTSYTYPTLTGLLQNFHTISPKVYQRLAEVTDAELAEPLEIGMHIPFIEETRLSFVGMCIGREDYLLGQLALMRRILDYPAMNYDFDETITY
ncbi:DinB family protein [Sphingobacterium suaedae]|uniref:DinB family protein n=1 Tax=Sphingobacterium suaedae TaxID=1686402 RepID=A0ABW5KHW9_9SPHI